MRREEESPTNGKGGAGSLNNINEKWGGVSNQWEAGRSLQLMRSGKESPTNEKQGEVSS